MKCKKLMAAVCALAIGFGFAAPSVAPFSAGISVAQAADLGVINWEKDTGADVQAMGIGLAPDGVPPYRARPMARRAAIVDAYRNLAEMIQGVNVDAETTVQDMVVASDTVNTNVKAVLTGARILSEGQNSDGSYYVIMSIPLYGVSGLAAVTMPAIEPPDANVFAGLPSEYATYSAGFTGVIIDARGMGLEPTFSPAIYDENGRGIYGTTNVDSKLAIEKGMVQYSKDLENAARNSRAGQNPLVIKALRTKGGANNVHKVHVVVSQEDGDRILAENAKSGMLGKLAVVFVR